MTERGMTLIELLIAIALLALLGVATATLLNTSINNESQIRTRADRLALLSHTLTQLRLDLEQAIPRKGASERFADSVPRAFIGYAMPARQQGVLFSFIRRGQRLLPGGQPNSELQYIRYRLAGERLIRESSPVPDPLPNQTLSAQPLLGGVSNMTVSYLGERWQAGWGESDSDTDLPRAVQIRFDTARWKNVELVTLLSGGVRVQP